jgi:hypothetical protein
MDGALEFVEHGCESNSNKAKTGLPNTLASASGHDFPSPLSLFVQRKGVASVRLNIHRMASKKQGPRPRPFKCQGEILR